MPDNAHAHLSAIRQHGNPDGGYTSLCSTSPADWDQIALAARESKGRIIPSFGIHPWFVEEALDELPPLLHRLIEEYPSAGIGETGLDKTRKAPASLQKQKDILLKHIELARQYNRVLSLHCVQAWGTLLDVISETAPPKVLLHAWNGHEEMIPRFASLGAFFSVGEKALASPDARNWLPLIPKDNLLLETDESNTGLLPLFEQLATHLRVENRNSLAETLHANFARLFL